MFSDFQKKSILARIDNNNLKVIALFGLLAIFKMKCISMKCTNIVVISIFRKLTKDFWKGSEIYFSYFWFS